MDLVGSTSASWGCLGPCVTEAGEAVASGRLGEFNKPPGAFLAGGSCNLLVRGYKPGTIPCSQYHSR